MSVTGSPGQGGTMAFSIDTVIARIRSIQLPEWIADAVDFTGLEELNWFNFLPANLKDGGIVTAELYHNTEIAIPTVRLVQNCTITLPIQTTGNAVAARIDGSGFITSLAFPPMITGEPMIQTITFKYDGIATPPAYTLESAT